VQHRLPRSARLALTGAKLAVIASIVVAGLVSQPATSSPAYTGPGYAGYPVDDSPSREARILDAHDCSVTGFADATPHSAVVRTAHGRLRHVSFDAGWAVYSRHGAAQLVAVCLDESPRRPSL
jgi:hypothetical protein